MNNNDKINGLDKNGHVKTCPMCNTGFTLDQLFHDPDIVPIGLCFEASLPDLNCYYFNHEKNDCRTTFTVQVEKFSSFIKEEIQTVKVTGSEQCEGRCLKLDDQDVCSQACHYAPYRALLTKMRQVKETNSQVLNYG